MPKKARTPPPRYADLETRLSRLEELVLINRRELDIQLQRIANMQVELDQLRSRVKSGNRG